MIDRRGIRINEGFTRARTLRAASLLAMLTGGLAGPAMAGAAVSAAQRAPARAAAPAAGFTIDVSYSPRAAAEMTRRREGLGILVFYDGEPNRLGRRHASEDGTLSMGDETLTISGQPQRVAISGRAFRPDRLGWIEGEAMVTVNFYSARRSGPDNFLDCGLIVGSVAQIAGRIHQARCRLIGEH